MGTRVRELRRRKALSQRELADLAGVSHSAVVSLESGTREPRPGTIRKVAAALGVPVERLTVGEGA